MYLGAAWYPEHWPESRWAEDVRLMREAGMNVCRIGEFAWSSMEPTEGQYKLDWVERAISLLHENGPCRRTRHADCRPACLADASSPGYPGYRAERTARAAWQSLPCLAAQSHLSQIYAAHRRADGEAIRAG